jgi:hypothetical protein
MCRHSASLVRWDFRLWNPGDNQRLLAKRTDPGGAGGVEVESLENIVVRPVEGNELQSAALGFCKEGLA